RPAAGRERKTEGGARRAAPRRAAQDRRAAESRRSGSVKVASRAQDRNPTTERCGCRPRGIASAACLATASRYGQRDAERRLGEDLRRACLASANIGAMFFLGD